MSMRFKTVVTTAGAARLAAATVPGGKKVSITAMAVGDGGGKLSEPDAGQTKLVNEVWRHALNKISQDNRHSNYIVAELLIPPEVGGFWVRELGLYDDEGALIAVSSLAESYKPALAEGSGRTQTCRMVIVVSSVESVALSVDSTMVMATQDYVDDRLAEHEESRNHPDATLTDRGFVKLYSGVTSQDETLAATPKAVKIAMDNASARLAKERNLADLTNIPLARQSLQLGNSATLNVGTTQGSVAAGDDSRITGAMQKSQNGGDIPDKDLFVRRIGATRAFDGAVTIGGDANPWTTAEFIVWLESQGAFNHPYWMCKGSWDYAGNKVITDTGCGNICLAGAVIEVMGTRGAMTIRVTTPTTTTGGGVPSAQFIYINHGEGYAPGWRREFSRTGDEMTGNLCLKNDGRVNFCIMNEDGTPRMWLFKDKGGDGVHINNGHDGGGDFIFGKDGSFYASAVRAGIGKKLSMTSDNNSTLTATFNLWGDANRPTVVELDDDQGWHLYSQRNPDGSIVFTVNGDITANRKLNVGAATFSSDGNVNGSMWEGWLSTWMSNAFASRDNNINTRSTWDYVNQTFVRDVRAGYKEYARVWQAYGYDDTPPYVITGVVNNNSDDLVDGLTRRPLQKNINGVWYNIDFI
ncbi:phage tail protein [Salmonella enterica]|nr:phage tail protein [Salmonella enterica]EBS4437386.1 phage tail protein [Salmonella enterica subsp. enterica serovar Guinea]EAM7577436.1 phage tail protein [Salmonella enterica]EAP1443971.1 phage tail protein [Salmonella enterica]EAT7734355.1 phage tail protein [Salmonella enterica]